MRVALQAIKSFHAEQLLAIAREAGLNIDILQSDCTALHNFATYEFFGKAGESQEEDKTTKEEHAEAIAMLDVGTHGSNLVISSPTLVWFRSIGVGGDAFTSDLLKPFRLTRAQAETLKRKPSSARRISQVYKAMEPTLSYLVEDVQRSVQSCLKLFPHVVIRRMFGVGGGFALHGLMRRLRYGR
jgi:Tfp pilus assembly PilM family ATPase